jgi:hypothetical protein
MGDVTYPRVDGVVFTHGAFQKGDVLYLPRKGARKILVFKDWTFRRIEFRKRLDDERERLRREFDASRRAAYLRHLAEARRAELATAGLTDKDLSLMERGMVPPKYDVHHILPLDDGGDNSFKNLILIRSRCEHSALSAYQNSFTRGLGPGEVKTVDYPVPDAERRFAVYPPSSGLPTEVELWPRRNTP